MADKTIGELKRATSLDDDSLMIAEQQGEAVSVTGGLFKSFAQESTKAFAESASADAATAAGAKDAAQSALKGVQAALNNLPAGGTLVINDLTTGGTTAALSAEMGKVLGHRPNPGLLDNAYFANPVNQRGKTEYSGSAYGIDRWKMGNANLKVEGDGISLAWTGASGSTNGYIQQFMEQDYSGREVTVSVLLDSGLYSMTKTLKAGSTDRYTLDIDGGNLQLNYGVYSTLNSVLLRNYTTTPVKVIAMKAELGSTQTLAHQDADGNWVLNEIPDYGEELAKCQRYLVKARGAARAYTVTPNGIRGFCSTPVSLRAKPALIGAVTVLTTGGVAAEGFSVNSLDLRDGGINVVLTKTSHGLSDASVTFGDGVYFSAEL